MDGGSFASSLALGVGIGAGFGLAKAYFSYFEQRNVKVEINISDATHQKLEGLGSSIHPTNLTPQIVGKTEEIPMPIEEIEEIPKLVPKAKSVLFPCNRLYNGLKYCIHYKRDSNRDESCRLYYGLIEECLAELD